MIHRSANLVILFVLMYILADSSYLFPIALTAVFFILIFPRYVKQTLISISFLVYFLMPRNLYVYRILGVEDLSLYYNEIFLLKNPISSLPLLIVKLLAGLCLMIGTWLLWSKIKPNRISSVWIGILMILGGWYTWSKVYSNYPLVGLYLFFVVSFLSRYLLAFLYFKSCHLRWIPKSPWHMISVTPFWQADIPSWKPKILHEYSLHNDISQKEISKELFRVVGVILFCSLTKFILFDNDALNIPFQVGIKLSSLRVVSQPAYYTWANLLFGGLSFLSLSMYVPMTLTVLMLNIVGIKMLLPFQKPLQGTTFADCFGRIFFYYGLIMTAIFYIPILQKLRRFELSNTFRKHLALLLSVYLMAILYHPLRDFWFFVVPYGKLSLVDYLIEYTAYAGTLAVLIVASSFFERTTNEMSIVVRLRQFLYFAVYCVLIFFTRVESKSFSFKIEYLKTLF